MISVWLDLVPRRSRVPADDLERPACTIREPLELLDVICAYRGAEPARIPCVRSRCPTRAAARGGRAPCTPGQGLRPLEPRFDVFSMPSVWRACLRADRSRQQQIAWFRHTGGMCRCIDPAASITCRGFGGVLRPQRGARGAEPARICEATNSTAAGSARISAGCLGAARPPSGEREGQSPLASLTGASGCQRERAGSTRMKISHCCEEFDGRWRFLFTIRARLCYTRRCKPPTASANHKSIGDGLACASPPMLQGGSSSRPTPQARLPRPAWGVTCPLSQTDRGPEGDFYATLSIIAAGADGGCADHDPAGWAAPEAASVFRRVWERQDLPVEQHVADRSWTWGQLVSPVVLGTAITREAFADIPGGSREVQYFDKSRMEINDPTADPNATWYVTNGLLPIELMTGRLQIGIQSFEDRAQPQSRGDRRPGPVPDLRRPAAAVPKPWRGQSRRPGQAGHRLPEPRRLDQRLQRLCQ